MSTQRERLLDEVKAAQTQLMQAMHRSEPFLLHLDLTMAQLKGLVVLADGAMTIGQLAEALGIGKPAASILVEHLVQHGLVERSEDALDRRRTNARLNDQGHDLVTRLREGKRDRFQGWLGRLHDDDLAALARGLRALANIATGDVPAADNAPGKRAPALSAQ